MLCPGDSDLYQWRFDCMRRLRWAGSLLDVRTLVARRGCRNGCLQFRLFRDGCVLRSRSLQRM